MDTINATFMIKALVGGYFTVGARFSTNDDILYVMEDALVNPESTSNGFIITLNNEPETFIGSGVICSVDSDGDIDSPQSDLPIIAKHIVFIDTKDPSLLYLFGKDL